MMQRFRESLKDNPKWIALMLCVILAAGDVWSVAGYVQKQRNADSLNAEALVLEGDLAQLQAAEAQGLQSLQDSLTASQDRLAALKAAFPNTGDGFDLFRRSFELAGASGVEIQSIRRSAESSQSSPAGMIHQVTYAVNATGGLSECMRLLGLLEDEGLQTVALNSIFVDPTAEACNFDVSVASVGPAEVQSSATGAVDAGGLP
jgi:hypothetical protein